MFSEVTYDDRLEGGHGVDSGCCAGGLVVVVVVDLELMCGLSEAVRGPSVDVPGPTYLRRTSLGASQLHVQTQPAIFIILMRHAASDILKSLPLQIAVDARYSDTRLTACRAQHRSMHPRSTLGSSSVMDDYRLTGSFIWSCPVDELLLVVVACSGLHYDGSARRDWRTLHAVTYERGPVAWKRITDIHSVQTRTRATYGELVTYILRYGS